MGIFHVDGASFTWILASHTCMGGFNVDLGIFHVDFGIAHVYGASFT